MEEGKKDMLNVTDKMILTAGPTISYKEIENVVDAILNGWNEHHSDYIKKFETKFADYIGVKYAMCTSSCTGALHLALLAMGVGPGDEVIVPETTWIATASAVKYVGATPIFADIEPDTWVMDPNSVANLISPRTKVIIPVHLYGHSVDMQPLWDLAKKYGIEILEDAAPSIGAEYKGKKTGSLGKAAAFSFQGAKALVTGEGGILVTDDRELIERARLLGDHGRDPNRALYNIEIGYKYKMSNLQAALGLAQTERAEEIVARKRQIFKWYEERLQNVKGIQLNVERSWARGIYWMSSLVLDESLRISRDEFMKHLKGRNIDSRPFFYPISSFPMFKDIKVDNPVAYDVPLRGINLPSGHERTEEEIDYICAHIKDILGYTKTSTKNVQPQGWLAYRDQLNRIIESLKCVSDENVSEYSLPIVTNGRPVGRLRPITQSSLEKESDIELLAKWRQSAQYWFPSQFNITHEGTKRWLEKQVLELKDRILFFVEKEADIPIGHLGLFRIDYKNKSCEIDNVVRGVSGSFLGGMLHACISLLQWTFETLGIENVYLRVASNNKRALKLYTQLGFKEILRVPLRKVQEEKIIKWLEVVGNPYFEAERYFVTMKLARSEWMQS